MQTKSALPAIFVINLAHSKERRVHMREMLGDIGLQYEFVDAIDGNEITTEELNRVYNRQITLRYWGRGMSLGEIGCYMSHVKAARIICERSLSEALVLEDDVYISPDIVPFLEHRDKLPDDWKIVHLSRSLPKPDAKVIMWYRKTWRPYKDYTVGLPHGLVTGVQAYLIRRSLAEEWVRLAYPIIVNTDNRLFNTTYSLSAYYSLRGKRLVEHGKVISDLSMFKSGIHHGDPEAKRRHSRKHIGFKQTNDQSLKPVPIWPALRFLSKTLTLPVKFLMKLSIYGMIYFFRQHKYHGGPILEFKSSYFQKLRFYSALYLKIGKGERCSMRLSVKCANDLKK